MEIFLIVLSVVCFLLLCFYLSSREQGENYMKVLAGIALLILAWIGTADTPFGPKLILTGLAYSSIRKGYLALKKNKGLTL